MTENKAFTFGKPMFKSKENMRIYVG